LQLKKPVKIRAPQKKQKPVEGAKARVSVKDPVTGEIKELGIVSNVSYETTNSDTLYPAPKPKTESKGFFDDEDE
jgi:hypothetical protein